MKNIVIGVLVVVGVAVLGWGLIFLARGEAYELTVFDPSIGPEDAPILIEEFADFQCPACAANFPIIADAIKEFPTQVRFVYRDYPISAIHPSALAAATGALCAAQQGKFNEFHDELFLKQAEWEDQAGVTTIDNVLVELALANELNVEDFNRCRDSRTAKKEVSSDFKEGNDREVTSTPTFFINGNKIETPGSVFGWIQAINKELDIKGIQSETEPTSEEKSGDEDKEETEESSDQEENS